MKVSSKTYYRASIHDLYGQPDLEDKPTKHARRKEGEKGRMRKYNRRWIIISMMPGEGRPDDGASVKLCNRDQSIDKRAIFGKKWAGAAEDHE